MLNIALNKISGSFDMPMLKNLMDEINVDSFDIGIIGYSENEIDQLFAWGTDVNPEDEWKQMPGFKQGDNKPYRSLIVHFETEKDFIEFQKKMGRQLTEKTKFIYYGKNPREKNAQHKFLNKDESTISDICTDKK